MVYPETGSPTNMMLKKSLSGVLASLRSSTYRGVRLRLFARCGLAWGKARLGRAGVGRVRSLAFLSILRGALMLS